MDLDLGSLEIVDLHVTRTLVVMISARLEVYPLLAGNINDGAMRLITCLLPAASRSPTRPRHTRTLFCVTASLCHSAPDVVRLKVGGSGHVVLRCIFLTYHILHTRPKSLQYPVSREDIQCRLQRCPDCSPTRSCSTSGPASIQCLFRQHGRPPRTLARSISLD